jgi:hypothetical protein
MEKYLLLSFVLFTQVNVHAQTQNTGWKSPTAIHAPNSWTNPQNAFVSDTLYATVIHQSGCRCPWIDLSWNNGTAYTNNNLVGPFSTVDSYQSVGSDTDKWGRAWIPADFIDSVFALRIANPSISIKQGYSGFGFGIPSGSTIKGIEVQVEEHGDSAFTIEYVNVIQVRVYYDLPTPVNEVYAGNNLVSVYPNPTHNSAHFRLSKDSGKVQIQILNLAGQQVEETELVDISKDTDYPLDMSHLSPGIYFLTITTVERVVNTRIVVE